MRFHFLKTLSFSFPLSLSAEILSLLFLILSLSKTKFISPFRTNLKLLLLLHDLFPLSLSISTFLSVHFYSIVELLSKIFLLSPLVCVLPMSSILICSQVGTKLFFKTDVFFRLLPLLKKKKFGRFKNLRIKKIDL